MLKNLQPDTNSNLKPDSGGEFGSSPLRPSRSPEAFCDLVEKIGQQNRWQVLENSHSGSQCIALYANRHCPQDYEQITTQLLALHEHGFLQAVGLEGIFGDFRSALDTLEHELTRIVFPNEKDSKQPQGIHLTKSPYESNFAKLIDALKNSEIPLVGLESNREKFIACSVSRQIFLAMSTEINTLNSGKMPIWEIENLVSPTATVIRNGIEYLRTCSYPLELELPRLATQGKLADGRSYRGIDFRAAEIMAADKDKINAYQLEHRSTNKDAAQRMSEVMNDSGFLFGAIVFGINHTQDIQNWNAEGTSGSLQQWLKHTGATVAVLKPTDSINWS